MNNYTVLPKSDGHSSKTFHGLGDAREYAETLCREEGVDSMIVDATNGGIPVLRVCLSADAFFERERHDRCVVHDLEAERRERQRECDLQDDHFMQHYCPEIETGPEE